jgi:hypothetical protein
VNLRVFLFLTLFCISNGACIASNQVANSQVPPEAWVTKEASLEPPVMLAACIGLHADTFLVAFRLGKDQGELFLFDEQLPRGKDDAVVLNRASVRVQPNSVKLDIAFGGSSMLEYVEKEGKKVLSKSFSLAKNKADVERFLNRTHSKC